MPLYELRQNAENRIQVSPTARDSIRLGTSAVVDAILGALRATSNRNGRTAVAAFEGMYGVDWPSIMAEVGSQAQAVGFPLASRAAAGLFRGAAEIAAYKKPFLTDDPGFGRANPEGRIEHLLDAKAVESLGSELARRRKEGRPGGYVVFGPGAAAGGKLDYDLHFYFDNTRQTILWQMWDGQVAPFGCEAPRPDYSWKEYYYCDFYLLEEQKRRSYQIMDFWVEGIDASRLKLVPRAAYDEILQTLVTYPVKEVKIFQPGPWGAYRYRDLWQVPGLECNAWNELAGPELAMIVEPGPGVSLTMPVTNLLQHPEAFVGRLLHEQLPGMFPLDIWLDDGYFPTLQPAERISMPIHNHPGTEYVKRKFNEPLGRYETYHIVEAYEGANTWMGFREDADLEEWERLCRRSERTGRPIENWKDFVANWESCVGDLYLIPPGTTHGHGGNQMVLEMDTVPSAAGTEYSFFMYDFCRPSWDDQAKTMTGKPVKMHLDHGFDADQYRRAGWVREHLRARPRVVKWTKEYWLERYSSYEPMPFEIERLHFERAAEYDTQGRILHILTLTVGGRVAIRSKAHPERRTEIERFQSAVVPACFGEYAVENLTGGQSTVAVLRWKRG